MSNVAWPERGNRGGSSNRPSRQYKETHNISTSVLALEAGKYYECSEIEDNSLTKRLHLRLWNNGYTLLRKEKPNTEVIDLVRVTSKSKRRVVEKEEIIPE